MKTMNKIVAVLLLLVLINSCGGGGSGGSSSIPSGYSKVQINVGSFRASTSSVPSAATMASTTVPAGVARLVFYDVRLSPLSLTKIAEFNVTEGVNEIFATLLRNGFSIVYVQALGSDGAILYVGARAINLTGGLFYIPIQMVPYSSESPQFNGLESITDVTSGSMVLHWSPATDDTTPQGLMQYLIYLSLTPGGEDLSTPSFTSDPGQTSFTVTGLSPNTTYYFIVRAMDQAMLTDSNTRELSATTLGSGGLPPVFRGLISAVATSPSDVALTWGPATDDDTQPQDIRYAIYMASQPGGENFADPRTVVKGVTSAFVRGLAPDTDYCFIARARDLSGNEDSNTVEKCVRTQQLPPAPVVDLFLTNIAVTGTGPYNITFDVNNGGTANATNVAVLVQYNDPFGYANVNQCITGIAVPGGGFTNQVVSLGFAPVSDYLITVDPNNTVPELNNANNTACAGTYCITPPAPVACP